MNYGMTQTDDNIRAMRSVARLLSLADRVERSCFQFRLIRVFLLWLLRPAELRVRRNVFSLARDAGLPELPDIHGLFDAAESGELVHNSAQEALDMAVRLRALATILTWLYDLDMIRDSCRDQLFRAGCWRRMRCLAKSAQSNTALKLRAARSGRATSRRLEVRQGVRSGLPVGSPDLPRQEARCRALHFAA